MVAKTQRKVIHLAEETTSYAQTTRPADSAYLAVPVLELGELEEGTAPIDTTRYTGRTGMTPAVPGPNGASWTSVHEIVGFDAAVGDGASPPAADRYDLLMDGIAGTSITRDGEAVASLATDVLTLDTDIYSVDELIYMVDANGVGEWGVVSVDNADASYDLSWAPGITPTVARGSRQWTDDDGNDTSITYSCIYDYDSAASNGAVYAAPGARIQSASMQMQADQQARMSLAWAADAKQPLTGGDIPTFSTGTNGDPAVQPTTPLRLACVYVDGVEVTTASVAVDFGLEVQPRPSSCSPNNRINMVQMAATPTVTIQPLYSEALLALRRSQAQRSVLVQVGVGDQSWALWLPVTQVSAAAPTDRSGEQDVTVTFSTKTTGTAARWRMARA